MPPTESTLTLILALGADTRLHPLTADRAKPAVPFGGVYRIIDFTLANCLRSGLRRVLVFTQYRSHSLQKHLRDGWSIYNPELGEFTTPVAPQLQKGQTGYRGSVDALRQNRYLLERNQANYLCLLCGEHIYRMDYAAMVEAHVQSGAEATVACLGFDGVAHKGAPCRVQVGPGGEVSAFEPPGPEAHTDSLMASMQVFVFNKDALLRVLDGGHEGLEQDGHEDPGLALIPPLLAERAHVIGYSFGGTTGRVTQDRYWCNPETLDDYYEANMDLLRPDPPIDLYQRDWPIRTYHAQHPPARTVPGRSCAEGVCINSIVASGSVIAGGGVNHSILFPRVMVEDGAMVEDCILLSGVEVGEGARLYRAIIEKDVRIPAGEALGYDRARDAERFTVTPKGIVVVPKGYRLS
jgi:glucose-1-phosphate adenylyltransferase